MWVFLVLLPLWTWSFKIQDPALEREIHDGEENLLDAILFISIGKSLVSLNIAGIKEDNFLAHKSNLASVLPSCSLA